MEKQLENPKGSHDGNRIVMINSFKGGAGKTTAALCRCVSEYYESTNHNIYYVDMDILGTGVDYVLSLEKQKIYYMKQPKRLVNLVMELKKLIWH